MANKKRRKINKSAIIIAVLSALVIMGFLLLFTNTSFWFKHSIHSNSRKYSTRSCLVFYPNNSEGKNVAKKLCEGVKDDTIYDYSLIPYGDYNYVSYGNGIGYFVDKDGKSIKIGEVSENGKRIIADYLRYTVKKQDPDTYYDSNFIKNSYIDNLDFTNATYEVENENLKVRLTNYDIDILVPLKYMQAEIGMNFGYQNELYAKPTYIDGDHPVVCLTFDDGPDLWSSYENSSSVSIVDTLYKYDATATFYICGYALDQREVWTDFEVYTFLKQSINNGNEYGSHTAGHEDLVDLSTADAIKKAINGPADSLNDLLGYKTLTYRPPGGVFNDNVLAAQPYPAILWNVDSEDWISEESEAIYNKVMSYDLESGDVILFHEIYEETAKAIEKIVPALIDKGIQLVTVKDMLQYEGIDVNSLHYYYNLNPWPYYE